MTWYISAFTLGLLSSFHCAGMCGPIAIMLPVDNRSTINLIAGRLIYNLGRVGTYILIGVMAGFLGLAISLQGFQRELSMIAGLTILVTLLISFTTKGKLFFYRLSQKLTAPMRVPLKMLFTKKTMLSLFFIGTLNGLLPCGFVYAAAAGATASGSVGGASLFMLFFGLGTFPVMMTFSLLSNFAGTRFRKIYARVSPIAMAILALLLVVRGAFVSIPENLSANSSNLYEAINCFIPH
ncbi:MAG: sulfite exporter TauE/SafE family protein [Bacteroidetes bacterium]|nr:sulfite exporter TauE/SafE family protein [Bacteroidota bacterium]